jgi:hypothetical protein
MSDDEQKVEQRPRAREEDLLLAQVARALRSCYPETGDMMFREIERRFPAPVGYHNPNRGVTPVAFHGPRLAGTFDASGHRNLATLRTDEIGVQESLLRLLRQVLHAEDPLGEYYRYIVRDVDHDRFTMVSVPFGRRDLLAMLGSLLEHTEPGLLSLGDVEQRVRAAAADEVHRRLRVLEAIQRQRR